MEVGRFMKADWASGGFLTSHATPINWPQLHCGQGGGRGESGRGLTYACCAALERCGAVLRIHFPPVGSLPH